MRVQNNVREVNTLQKATKGFAYLAIGRSLGTAEKTIYVIKQTGQRSWHGINIDAGIMGHVSNEFKHNAGGILGDLNNYINEIKIWRVMESGGKITMRKVLMELLAYGTVNETNFNIDVE